MRALLVCVVLPLVVAGCASSRGTPACDPAVETCTCSESGECADGYECADNGICVADTPDVDAGPLKGFGEPCTDRAECESNICILVGIGGICTDLCVGGDCPENYGCLGVLDSVEQGEVANVCVPVSNQLCSPCSAHTECTLVGQDLCVANDLGDSFCARDCDTIECPDGYSCDEVEVEGDTYEQCIPNSGYCDCVAENEGLTEACTITSPPPYDTTCEGTRTCAGADGWSACLPPSPDDDPDDDFEDANCDGIDGDVDRGIFVSVAGANAASCGTSPGAACQTIAFGVVRASQTGRQHVYVQTGTYDGVVPLIQGISIYGGYDLSWQRGPYSIANHRVAIRGTRDDAIGGDGEWLAIRAHDLIAPVTIDNLVILAPVAEESGKSSYGVHVDAAAITITNVEIVGNNGGNGSAGGAGSDAISIAGAPGGNTGGGGSEQTDCDGSSHGGGAGAVGNSCAVSPSSRNMTGGGGGNGGEMDDSCPFDLDATSGDAGGPAAHAPSGFGYAGGGGPPNSPSEGACNGGGGNGGGTGGPGAITNGGPGTGASGGTISNGYWYGRGGNPGVTGDNGGGGGGGGGSGGCDGGTDAWGAGGGSGGAGGCAARGGGGGGTGAGASFAVFATGNSQVTMASCSLSRGNGGSGGGGGTGGRGQPGGAPGLGGAHPGSSPAGNGGRGGHGGHGGGGGGGAGGHAVGIGYTPGTSVNQTCAFGGGAAGPGGAGGVSAPAVQGTFEDDGSDGGNGGNGSLQNVRACTSGSSC